MTQTAHTVNNETHTEPELRAILRDLLKIPEELMKDKPDLKNLRDDLLGDFPEEQE